MNNPNQCLAISEGSLATDAEGMFLGSEVQFPAPEDRMPASPEPDTLYVPEKPTTGTVATINREGRRVSKSHISPDATRSVRQDGSASPKERQRAVPTTVKRRVGRGTNNKGPGKLPFASNPKLAQQIAKLQQR